MLVPLLPTIVVGIRKHGAMIKTKFDDECTVPPGPLLESGLVVSFSFFKSETQEHHLIGLPSTQEHSLALGAGDRAGAAPGREVWLRLSKSGWGRFESPSNQSQDSESEKPMLC